MVEASLIRNKPYISKNWQQQRELIEHVVQFDEEVVLLLAPNGGGKTTFSKFLAANRDTKIKKILLNAHDRNIIDTLCDSMSLKGMKLSTDLQHLKSAIQAKIENSSQIWTIIIDDAVLLSEEILTLFLELSIDTESEKHMKLILTGGKRLLSRIQHENFNTVHQGKIKKFLLAPWTLQDLRDISVQFGKLLSLSSKELSVLHQKSKGWPGPFFQAIAMRLSDKSFDRSSIQKPVESLSTMNKRKKPFLTSPIFLGMAMGVMFVAVYLGPHLLDEDEELDVPSNAALYASSLTAEKAISGKKDYSELAMIDETALPKQDSKIKAAPLSLEVAKASQSENKHREVNKFGYTKDEETLLLSNSRHYTIELRQENDAKRALEFIAKHGLSDSAALFRRDKDGARRYVVVYGKYASASNALGALDKMPDSLSHEKVHPAVRELKGVQEEIRARKEG